MGFAVLHIQKPKGNDARTTVHIEGPVNPANADSERSREPYASDTAPDRERRDNP